MTRYQGNSLEEKAIFSINGDEKTEYPFVKACKPDIILKPSYHLKNSK